MIEATRRVIVKRTIRGATVSSIVAYLDHLRNTVWKYNPTAIDEIKQEYLEFIERGKEWIKG